MYPLNALLTLISSGCRWSVMFFGTMKSFALSSANFSSIASLVWAWNASYTNTAGFSSWITRCLSWYGWRIASTYCSMVCLLDQWVRFCVTYNHQGTGTREASALFYRCRWVAWKKKSPDVLTARTVVRLRLSNYPAMATFCFPAAAWSASLQRCSWLEFGLSSTP